MPLYRCETCGCIENTATGFFYGRDAAHWPDDVRGKALCSACAPPIGADGKPTGFARRTVFTGYTFGLRNIYRDQFAHALRRYLKIAATGELAISRIADGTSYSYVPDMFGWLRAGSRARRAAQAKKA